MAAALAKVGVLFVCMANICRSPTAEGVFRRRIEQAGLDKRIRIDSAGTHAFHVGEHPDKRSVAAAARRQYDLASIRARKIAVDDFAKFEFVLAMDRNNLTQLARLRPAGHTGHVGLLLDFAPGFEARDVPDPYYGGIQGFELVLDLVEAGADGLLARVRERLGES